VSTLMSGATSPEGTVQPDTQYAGQCNNPIIESTEYYMGTWYYSAWIPPIVNVPKNAILYSVAWTYAISPWPFGQVVQLCDQVPSCTDISSLAHGYTPYFNGHLANTNFRFKFYVPGSGQLSPWVTPNSLQVCTAYSY
jgi:hypothetical protein